MKELWLPPVVAILLAQFVCSSMIPGRGCGYRTPFRVKEFLGPDDVITDLGCTYVHDRDSFREYYVKKIPGNMNFYQRQNDRSPNVQKYNFHYPYTICLHCLLKFNMRLINIPKRCFPFQRITLTDTIRPSTFNLVCCLTYFLKPATNTLFQQWMEAKITAIDTINIYSYMYGVFQI